MTSNSNLTLTSLDFDVLKQNLKNFLSSQSTLKDYNFEGPNLSVLMDLLTYNTYLSSFYNNMIFSEAFIDSAQLLNSILSHAKELNYLPYSMTSAEAIISFIGTANSNSPTTVTLPKGTRFFGINSNGSFGFVTNEAIILSSANGTFNSGKITIYEGQYVSETFVVNYAINNQKFILSNPNIDINSLQVNVIENAGASNTEFKKEVYLYGLDKTSNVYFVQASTNGQYEVVFGDNVIGRTPQNLATIKASYRVSHGSDAVGIAKFNLSDSILTANGQQVSIPPANITVYANSAGGSNSESIESIRYAAPRYYAAQQRGVASDDYKSLVLQEFGGNISDLNAFGGELLDPPKFGYTALCILPLNATVLPDFLKQQISNYLLPFTGIPAKTVIVEPDYLYISVFSNVYFNSTQTSLTVNEIETKVLDAMQSYAQVNLTKFNGNFRYSKFLTSIDNCDTSIQYNDTTVRMIKKLYPNLNANNAFTVQLQNPIFVEPNYPGQPNTINSYLPAVNSSQFTWVNSNGVNISFCSIQDDNKGNLILYNIVNRQYNVLNANFGSVDYDNGVISVPNFNSSNYGSALSFYVTGEVEDINIQNQQIILLDTNDVNLLIKDTNKKK